MSKFNIIDSPDKFASPIQPSLSSRWSQSVGTVIRFDLWAPTAIFCMRFKVSDWK